MEMYRIYYSDSTMFTEGEGSFEHPSRGIQAIVQHNKTSNWHTESHGDFYLMKDDGLWHAADVYGLFTELIKRKLIRPTVGMLHEVYHQNVWVMVDSVGFNAWIDSLDWVLCGETIGNERFREIFQHALADAAFGQREGFLAGERKP